MYKTFYKLYTVINYAKLHICDKIEWLQGFFLIFFLEKRLILKFIIIYSYTNFFSKRLFILARILKSIFL